jgi:uncharacterized protein involved in exopolysaccharide biosynthesis
MQYDGGMAMSVATYDKEEPLNFAELIAMLRARRWWIVACVLISTAVLTTAAFLMTPIYRASVIVIPANVGGDLDGGSALGQLGGIASMIGLGVGSRANETEEALAVMRSRQFTERFISDNGLIQRIYAGKWDAANNRWRVSSGKEPTLAKAYERFDKRIRSIIQDKKTGLITITVDWSDPQEAAVWANEQVSRINDEMRARAMKQADASVGYLEEEMQKTNVVPTREAIGRLVEAQIKQRMLANVTREYAFRVVDRAMPAESDNPVRPRRLMMILGGVFGGFALGVVLVLSSQWLQAPIRREPHT